MKLLLKMGNLRHKKKWLQRLESGVAIETIAKAIGLTIEEIESLKNEEK
jgi:hypothetical protein